MGRVVYDNLEKMKRDVINHLENMGYIKDKRIKRAMLKVRRELFVSKEYYSEAYIDTPLPIPGGMTISAPHMHAIFMSALKLKPGDKVLEIGAGSGILLAYMKEVVGKRGKVFGIEIVPETFKFALENLEKAGYSKKVKLILGDGSKGLREEAPFDKIISSASSPHKIPKTWIDQLKIGGIIVTPIGATHEHQELYYFEKVSENKVIKKKLGGVVFVQLKGKYGWK